MTAADWAGLLAWLLLGVASLVVSVTLWQLARGDLFGNPRPPRPAARHAAPNWPRRLAARIEGRKQC